MNRPLAGLRVVELASEIAGPYCTKLLVDLGADVCKIEPPSGDPLRRWGPRSGLFEYLNAGKRGTAIDPADPGNVAAVHEMIAGADVLVESLPVGASERREWGLDAENLDRINPNLVVVRISSFGQEGPLRDRVTTPLTLQAAAGWVNVREPGRAPVQAGARIPEYIAGSYAALGALTALRIAAAGTNRPVEVDVSMFESLLSTLPYPMLMAARLKTLNLPTNSKAAPMLGIVHAADGWIGINCLTGQHWLDVCAMVGLPEFGEHQLAIMLGGPERDEFFAKAQSFLDSMAVADLVDLSQAMRIPAAPILEGDTILSCPQYAERGFFIESAEDAGRFARPGPPFRLSKTPVPPPLPAPAIRTETPAAWGERAATRRENDVLDVALPFAGLKVFDLSTFWAGAYLTCYLGAFGADVIKVESIQRPDGHRYSGALLREGDDWYERGPLWQGTNLNKRDITLDLTSAAGRELALRLAAEADVVVENFSPRVVEQFGLDYDSVVTVNPDVIMVRMPGFGLAGPWREYVGWALNIEQVSGMSAATGYADGPPCNLQGPADPIAGVHACIALLAALEHRRSTGEGQLIEVAQIEVGAAVTPEPVIEYSLTGTVRPREGNRHREYAQGVYPTGIVDEWVALSVRDDRDWLAVLDAMTAMTCVTTRDSRPQKPVGKTTTNSTRYWRIGRARDPQTSSWRRCTSMACPPSDYLGADRMYDVEQLDARGFYQNLNHSITGRHRFPGWPFRFSPGPAHQHRTAAPTLGQHNAEVLAALGLSDAQIATLSEQQVIGQRVLNA